MAIPYRVLDGLPLIKRLFVLRLFNLPFYLATIAFTWLIAGELFARLRWKQTLAAGVVALQPQLAFMSAVINADIALAAMTTAFVYAALRLVRAGPSLRRVVAASALSAAALLTHGRLASSPCRSCSSRCSWPTYASAPTSQRRSDAAGPRSRPWESPSAHTCSSAARRAAVSTGGQVDAIQGFGAGRFSVRQFLSSIYQFYFQRLPSMQLRPGPDFGYRQVFIETFYGTFGWLEIHFRPFVYELLQIASALGLVALYTACVTRWRAIVREWPSVVVMLSLVATLIVFLHYVSYRSLLANGGSDPIIVGRYLLPMISLFGVAVAFTVGALPRRAGRDRRSARARRRGAAVSHRHRDHGCKVLCVAFAPVARISRSGTIVIVMAVLIIIGMLVWFVPYLNRDRLGIASVAAPPASFAIQQYRLAPGATACMNAVTMDPRGALAAFQAMPLQNRRPSPVRVRLVLSALGYREAAVTPPGYRGGPTTLAVRPPQRSRRSATPAPSTLADGPSCLLAPTSSDRLALPHSRQRRRCGR